MSDRPHQRLRAGEAERRDAPAVAHAVPHGAPYGATDGATRAASASRAAWWAGWRLAVVLVATVIAGCRGSVRARPGGPAAGGDTVQVRPGVVPGQQDSLKVPADSLRDSVARDSLGRDSAALEAQRRDSLAADSIARAAALRDSIVRDSVRRDSVNRARRKPASRDCIMDFAESPPETRMLYSRLNDSVSNTFIGGGFVGRCQGENNRLRADSAEQFQAAGIVNLYGNVMYEEIGKMQMTASRATYFTREGRLYADGSVVATQLSTGSTFTGPQIEYYRATPERLVSRLVAPMRSTARLVERDSLGRLQPPVTVVANRFEDAGDSLLMAWGDVTINRQTIDGRSDSAAFDKLTQKARLVRGARITNADTSQRFVLTGDTIDLYSSNRQLVRVYALHKATATTDQMTLNAENIDLRLTGQELTEAFAFGEGRARATTPQQDVEADSMRIRLGERMVKEVRALGGAIAVGTPDTLRIRTDSKDVLRGDSVFAFFDTTVVATADTASGVPAAPASQPAGTARSTQAKLREIRAMGNASSLFHIANSRGPTAPPGINYVRGQQIFVNFDTGAVRDVRVDSAASGVYLEPAPDSLSDSTARLDSLGRNSTLRDSTLRDTTRRDSTRRETTGRRRPPDTLQVAVRPPSVSPQPSVASHRSRVARHRERWFAFSEPLLPERAPTVRSTYYSPYAFRRRI